MTTAAAKPEPGQVATKIRQQLPSRDGGMVYLGHDEWKAVLAALGSSLPVPDEVRRLSEAAQAFSLCVYNDNGDVSVSTSDIAAADWLALKRAVADVSALLATPSGRPDTPPAGGEAVPEGYWLAPLEATDAMMDAAGTCLTDGLDRSLAGDEGSSLGDIWRAYREAAPAAPEPAAGGGLSLRTLLEWQRDALFERHESGEGYRLGDDGRCPVILTNAEARNILGASPAVPEQEG